MRTLTRITDDGRFAIQHNPEKQIHRKDAKIAKKTLEREGKIKIAKKTIRGSLRENKDGSLIL